MIRAGLGRAIERISPRMILIAGFVLFLIYAWPGYVGWDTLTHFMQARGGSYSDSHPPAVARLFRVVELFIAGPAGVLLLQAGCAFLGLHGILARRLTPRAAALATVTIFVFPPIAGVTAYVVKDTLMAGFLLLGISFLLDDRPRRQRLGLGLLLLANLMRWNALAATFAPVILLHRWQPTLAGWRRYSIALGVWLGVTGTALVVNEVLADRAEHYWYTAHAVQDVAGTLQYMPDQTDDEMHALLAGLRLHPGEQLHQRFRARYNPADYRQIAWQADKLFEKPAGPLERAAIVRAWNQTVLAYPGAYFRYRWDNFKLLIKLERPPTFSNVYLWFTVVAAPETVAQLQHDAYPSRIQSALRGYSIAVSLTPVYFVFVYFAACFVVLVLSVRHSLEAALCLSGIGYQLAWFFLAPTTDFRYSQWMMICALVSVSLLAARRSRFARAPG
ncbi:MAG: hypothetical protein M3680_09415 [Myxococcota bacterium]|nr:hypothetical protein [Myxococcota bacterium]